MKKLLLIGLLALPLTMASVPAMADIYYGYDPYYYGYDYDYYYPGAYVGVGAYNYDYDYGYYGPGIYVGY